MLEIKFKKLFIGTQNKNNTDIIATLKNKNIALGGNLFACILNPTPKLLCRTNIIITLKIIKEMQYGSLILNSIFFISCKKNPAYTQKL